MEINRGHFVKCEEFGHLPNGTQVDLYTLANTAGMQMKVTNYGGIMTSIIVPDRYGKMADVVLGFDELQGYLQEHPYFGALVGRYANRIANGTFTIGSKTYHLPKNNGPNTLHGGLVGFDKKIWSAQSLEREDAVGIHLSDVSPDGEEGFPGNLTVNAQYWLTDNNEVVFEYQATTDQPTVCNLTNHSYFNLAGAGSGSIFHHQLQLNASHYTPVDKHMIPTGKLESVEGTPFDFRKPMAVGMHINEQHPQLLLGKGYDHNFVLDDPAELKKLGSLFEPGSGRLMEIWTTEPGVQIYTSNFLEETIGKQGKKYGQYDAICLETQHFPDAPNQPKFPSTLLKPGENYYSKTVYKFSVKS